MTETTYEVRISVWNLDADNKDHKMTDFREFSDKDAAYRFAELWTNTFDKYIREGKKRRYATYAKAAALYSVPYYSMVKIAREAKASWKIRKTVIVDLDKLDAKIEQQIL